MSVNFYNNRGAMAGLDIHECWTGPPPPPIGTLASGFYVVGLSFRWPTAINRTGTVTSDGVPMLQDGFDAYLVPHVFTNIPPPGPLQSIVWMEVFLLSATRAFMSVHSVRAEGKPLATCLLGAFGSNINCNLPVAFPSDLVLDFTTVTTTPSAGDYVSAFVAAAVSAGWSVLLKALALTPDGLIGKHIFRRMNDFLKWLGLAPDDGVNILSPASKIKSLVQKAVDQGL